MLVQAIMDETERANLLGNVPALLLVAFVLWYLLPETDWTTVTGCYNKF